MRKHFYLQGKVTGSYTCRFMQTLMILSFFSAAIYGECSVRRTLNDNVF